MFAVQQVKYSGSSDFLHRKNLDMLACIHLQFKHSASCTCNHALQHLTSYCSVQVLSGTEEASYSEF